MLFIYTQSFYRGLTKELKKAGKADTNHNEPIDEETEDRIHDLLAKVQKIMEEKDTESENFKNLVESLPVEYPQTWHIIAQFGVMFLIMKNFARRGREGFDIMTKDHYEKRFCSKSKLYAWKQRRGEKTKNHQTTNQDLSKGGVITFKTYPNGKIFIYFLTNVFTQKS